MDSISIPASFCVLRPDPGGLVYGAANSKYNDSQPDLKSSGFQCLSERAVQVLLQE